MVDVRREGQTEYEEIHIASPPKKCIVFAGAALTNMGCMRWKTGDGDMER